MREFAKCERANSWQSKGKFAFKFVDCHAVFVKTARNDGVFGLSLLKMSANLRLSWQNKTHNALNKTKRQV